MSCRCRLRAAKSLIELSLPVVLIAFGGLTAALAQPAIAPGQRPTPEQMRKIQQMQQKMAAGANAQPPGGAKAANEKPKKEDDKQGGSEKPDGDSVQRPDEPANVPDPSELEVQLDENGRVPPFSFAGHSWPDVLQWIANLAEKSLDWQELPQGYLNLSTRRSLSVEEVRDLINRTLHARGYTILVKDGVMSVFKLDKLDPSLIPKVEGELDLYELPPNDFVKIVFELPDGMEVDKAVEDVKQLLSPHHKVFPLVTARVVQVMDTVANLRNVSEVLNQERAAALNVENIQEFPLKYARADQVIDILYVTLGMEPQSQPTQMELAMQQQQMQMMMQMQQQGKDVSKLMKEEPPVHLVFNRRRNSVIANAPPEEMRVIAETVKLLDIPQPGVAESANPAGNAMAASLSVKRYPLVSMDPGSLKDVLEGIGNLHPFTELDTVEGSKLLFARATPDDHEKILSMIDELDGSGRTFRIVRLRYKAAEVVAAGIYNLMVGEEEPKEESNNRYPYLSYRFGNQKEKKERPNEGFRIYADVESNSIWLWATDTEMEAVNKFLMELGEVRSERATDQAVRTLDAFGTESTEELIERIRKAWSGKNPLQVVPAEPAAPDDDAAEGDQPEETDAPDESGEPEDLTAANPPFTTRFAQLEAATDEPSSGEPAAAGDQAPIKISITEDGRLVLSSADAQAVDQLEELVAELMPPPERFKRIRLKHIGAQTMKFIMDDLFAKEIEGENEGHVVDAWERVVGADEPQRDFRLSRRANLMFDWDQQGNSLIVANATQRQLYEIEQVVKMYDQPHEFDESLLLSRRTEPIHIKYSKASIIATAVKDAYRDLLSQTDKAFQSDDEENGDRAPNRKSPVWSVIHYGQQKTERMPARFDGALAIGVDEVANVIIVSATEELFDNVRSLITQLDEQAKPTTTVAVHRIGGSIKTERLQQSLAEILGKPWIGGQPEPSPQQQQQPNQQRPGDQSRQRPERGPSREFRSRRSGGEN